LDDLLTILFLLQHKQQVFLSSCPPDSIQSAPRSPAPEDYETQPAYADHVRPQNGLDDCLPGHSALIAQHIGQLGYSSASARFLHPLDVPARTLDEIIPLPPVGPNHANLLAMAETNASFAVG
jgi:hypothetical protein